MSKLGTYVKDFTSYLDSSTRLLPGTKKRYLYELRRFIAYLQDPDITRVTPMDVLGWHQELIEAGGGAQTVLQKHAAVRRFLVYLDEFASIPQAKILRESLKKLSIPREAFEVRRPPYALSAEQIKKVLAIAVLRPGTGYRDRALIQMMLSAGLRREEVQRLLLNDVDMKACSAQVTGKGDKKRTVLFDQECRDVLQIYHEHTADWREPGDRALFISVFGEAMSLARINTVVQEVGEMAGVRGGLWPHILRHSFITGMLERGMRIQDVSALAGHTSIQTTMRYVHPSDSHLKAEFQKAMARKT